MNFQLGSAMNTENVGIEKLDLETQRRIDEFERYLAEHGDEPCSDCGHPLSEHGVLELKYWGWVYESERRAGRQYRKLLHRVPRVACGVFVPCSEPHDPNDPESYDSEQCACQGHSLWPVAERPKDTSEPVSEWIGPFGKSPAPEKKIYGTGEVLPAVRGGRAPETDLGEKQNEL